MISRSQILPRPNSKFSQTNSCRIPLSTGLSLQVYSYPKPRNYKTADIQKGLIIVHNGLERVGEGTGFGVPVVKYVDETYFSGSAEVYTALQKNGTKIIKNYVMDTVRRKKLGKIDVKNRVVRGFSRRFVDACQKHKHLRSLMLADLKQRFNLRSDFVRVEPVGHISVTYYGKHRGCIKVKADFDFIRKKGLQKIFLLNEQGASFFRKYQDSNGAVLFDRQIGTWEMVNAEWAEISAPKNKVGFRLRNLEDSVLRRGREFLKGNLDWIGLDYEIGPDNAEFGYKIEVLGA